MPSPSLASITPWPVCCCTHAQLPTQTRVEYTFLFSERTTINPFGTFRHLLFSKYALAGIVVEVLLGNRNHVRFLVLLRQQPGFLVDGHLAFALYAYYIVLTKAQPPDRMGKNRFLSQVYNTTDSSPGNDWKLYTYYPTGQARVERCEIRSRLYVHTASASPSLFCDGAFAGNPRQNALALICSITACLLVADKDATSAIPLRFTCPDEMIALPCCLFIR